MDKKRIIITGTILLLVVLSIFLLESSKNKVEQYENPVVILEDTNMTENNYQWINPDAANFKQVINPKYLVAPELAGISGWINAEPFKLSDLRGKVVIIDFWTYSCINCIRTLPYLVEWDKKYRDDGLVIIGVHAPEFFFEKKIENVIDAVNRHNITYPVVQDNDRGTWNAYRNRYWPHKFLIDANGQIRYDHIGEGGYAETEAKIQELLAEIGAKPETHFVDIEEQTPTTRNTPELYAGYAFALPRGQNVANNGGIVKDTSKNYVLPDSSLTPGRIYLEGEWKSNKDNLEAISDGAVILLFTAKSANIVAESLKEYIDVKVLIDEKMIAINQFGKDVIETDGVSVVRVDEPRLYNLFSSDYGTHTLRLEVEKGFTFNAFTFG